MREGLEVAYLMLLNTASLTVGAVGGVMTSCSSIINIYFQRAAKRHDDQYASKPSNVVELSKAKKVYN